MIAAESVELHKERKAQRLTDLQTKRELNRLIEHINNKEETPEVLAVKPWKKREDIPKGLPACTIPWEQDNRPDPLVGYRIPPRY